MRLEGHKFRKRRLVVLICGDEERVPIFIKGDSPYGHHSQQRPPSLCAFISLVWSAPSSLLLMVILLFFGVSLQVSLPQRDLSLVDYYSASHTPHGVKGLIPS